MFYPLSQFWASKLQLALEFKRRGIGQDRVYADLNNHLLELQLFMMDHPKTNLPKTL